MSTEPRSNYRFLYKDLTPEKLYSHLTLVDEKREEVVERGYDPRRAKNAVRGLIDLYDQLKPDGEIDGRPAYYGSRLMSLYDNWGNFIVDKDFPDPDEYQASIEERMAGKGPVLRLVGRKFRATGEWAGSHRRLLSAMAGCLCLLWVYVGYSRAPITVDFDPQKVIAAFLWGEQSVILLDDGTMIEPGVRVRDVGIVDAIDQSGVHIGKVTIELPRVRVLNSPMNSNYNDNCLIYNCGIKSLEQLFVSWGYDCDFRANHQITMIGTARNSMELIRDFEKQRVIFTGPRQVATIGNDRGFIFCSPGLTFLGNKRDLAVKYQVHTPEDMVASEMDDSVYLVPLLQPHEMINFLKSDNKIEPSESKMWPTTPNFSSVYDDVLYTCIDGTAYGIDLQTSEIFQFPVKDAVTIATDGTNTAVTVFNMGSNHVLQTVMFDGRQRIGTIQGGALSVSYTGSELFTDFGVWQVRDPKEGLLGKTVLDNSPPYVENSIGSFKMPTIYEDLLCNIKGFWVVSLSGKKYVVGALEPKLYPIEGGAIRFLDLTSYVPPPLTWMEIDEPVLYQSYYSKMMLWRSSFSVILGAWAYNDQLVLAVAKDGLTTVYFGKKSFTLDPGESCAGVDSQGRVVVLKSQEDGPAWRAINPGM